MTWARDRHQAPTPHATKADPEGWSQVVLRTPNQRRSRSDTLLGQWRCVACRPGDGQPAGEGWCPTLRQLAVPFGTYPGYHDEWRP